MKTLNLPPLSPTQSAAQLRHALQTNREQTLTQLYQHTFPMVRHYVLQHGGTAQDAKDVFHDALIVFYEKAVAGTLELTASASTYLVAVARNIWRREVDRRQRCNLADLNEEHLQVPDQREPAEAGATAEEVSVLEYVERLGEKCKSILLSFYYFQQPLEQIASTHQYRNVRSATVQKFKCLERLRNSVRNVLVETFSH
ncbi:RNA polymerase sigma factor [Hymenobacter volaticus]|uniref:Sigma-70 family RNA polymerase sigma factor n=1 Tax=Hymenobacter volaticus TaxID=2932254 RepID=A0ABY4G1I1_9BACT|nr:sigma-70 family RNA polymerase sigma factor [Hymenobacter volaticus]UOQ64666.1 sigma-70 family RNA polymerase sigma factor [Hymenobacter volaticus]